jgi:hypothetical protein
MRFPDGLLMAFLGERADGTVDHALAAIHAGHGVQTALERGSDGAFEAAMHEVDGSDLLRLMTDAHAASAENALLRIAFDGRARDIDARAAALAL